jgi:hypothetical protein
MKKIFFLYLFFVFSFHSAFAADASHLYQIEISVAAGAEDSALREAAFQQAWEQVLIRVSGKSQVLMQNPDLKKLNAANYVASYSYKALEKPVLDLLPYLLTINFQEDAVIEALKKANQAAWTGDRSALLVWIAVQDQQGSRLIGADSAELILKSIQNLAKKRGIPLVVPILDLGTLNQISAEDVNNSNWDLIEKVSTPYQQGGTLLLQIAQNSDGTWVINTKLLLDHVTQEGTVTGSDENTLLVKALNTAMDAFANHYTALLSAPDNTVVFQINQISTLEQYAAVKDLLAHLSLVSRSQVLQVWPSAIRFTLQVKGDQAALQNALQGSNQLFLIDTGIANEPLTYAWQAPLG